VSWGCLRNVASFPLNSLKTFGLSPARTHTHTHTHYKWHILHIRMVAIECRTPPLSATVCESLKYLVLRKFLPPLAIELRRKGGLDKVRTIQQFSIGK